MWTDNYVGGFRRLRYNKFQEPGKDIFDMLDDAEHFGTWKAEREESEATRRKRIVPYTEAELKEMTRIEREEMYSDYQEEKIEKHYFCKYCGEEFFSKNKHRRKYCSQACCIAMHRYKNKKAKEAETMQQWREQVRGTKVFLHGAQDWKEEAAEMEACGY